MIGKKITSTKYSHLGTGTHVQPRGGISKSIQAKQENHCVSHCITTEVKLHQNTQRQSDSNLEHDKAEKKRFSSDLQRIGSAIVIKGPSPRSPWSWKVILYHKNELLLLTLCSQPAITDSYEQGPCYFLCTHSNVPPFQCTPIPMYCIPQMIK